MVDLLNGLANLALKPFGIPPARDAEDAPPSEDELHELLRASSRHGLIDHAELVLSENALELDDVPVREVMVPRADLPYVTTDGDVDTVIAHMRDSGVLRLPLCEPDGGLDAAVGVIEPEALVLGFADGGRPSSLTAAAGPLDRVPDGTAIQEVLTRMRRGHLHFVLAVDEHGTTVGGVSHEQITDVLTRGLDDEATERPAAY
jgi:CBS domain containing-hemolysin-like protein